MGTVPYNNSKSLIHNYHQLLVEEAMLSARLNSLHSSESMKYTYAQHIYVQHTYVP